MEISNDIRYPFPMIITNVSYIISTRTLFTIDAFNEFSIGDFESVVPMEYVSLFSYSDVHPCHGALYIRMQTQKTLIPLELWSLVHLPIGPKVGKNAASVKTRFQ